MPKEGAAAGVSGAKIPGRAALDVADDSGAAFGGQRVETKDPHDWTITQFGSTSLYYNRNQGGRDFFVPPRLQLGWDKESIYQVYQDSAVGALNYEATFENGFYTGRLHAATSQENSFIADQDNETIVSSLYLDGKHKESGVSARIGRQSRFSGGVLGRFDGALAGFDAGNDVQINVVAGSPVERSRDEPFSNDAYFYGLSADFLHWRDGVDTGFYFIDQRASGTIDRQAIGTELRFLNAESSAFGTFDYDIHYMELNNAILSGTYVFPDFSIFGLNFDYRRAPLIFTRNALQGQPVVTLSDLLKIYTNDEVERLSLDRTAKSYSAGFNFSHQLNENLLFSADATLTYMSATQASGGMAAMPSTGTEFYSSAQLTRTGIFDVGDRYTAGVRFADTQWAYRYMLEGSASYPVTKDWRIGPVLRLGYIDLKAGGESEYEVMPALQTTYYLSDDLVLEFEVGKNGSSAKRCTA